ncbi:hypothetical protein [Neoasaia chiangmaiensis]|nr:hypothetical protein [Neoasaia chiangmaiensis]
MRRCFYWGAFLLLTACGSMSEKMATYVPEEIAPTYVADSRYAGLSCQALAQTDLAEGIRFNQSVTTARRGVVASGLTPTPKAGFSALISPNDRATLALGKGTLEALHRAEVRRGCPWSPLEVVTF